MIKKILVAADDSIHARKAIDYASDIALKYNATVYVIHVVNTTFRLGDYELMQKMEDALRQGGKEIVEKAESEIRVKGVKHFRSAVLVGDPATEIIRYTKENGVDMVVIGSRGEGTLEGLLFGSVSQKVCQLASCTCVTVK